MSLRDLKTKSFQQQRQGVLEMLKEQECILVGCVPPAYCHVVSPSMYCSGVYLGRGGVPGLGVYLVQGVHLVWGVCTWSRGCTWSGGCVPGPGGFVPGLAGVDPGFGQGGPQVLRLKVAEVAKRSRVSEASNLWLGSRARLRALEAFGFLMLKYALSHILETLFL